MKKKLFTLFLVALFVAPYNFVLGQVDMKVASTTKVKISTDTKMKVSDDFTVATGAAVKIMGDVTIGGTVVCSDATAIVIRSTSASLDGSFIFEAGTPLATVERFVTHGKWHQMSIPVSGGNATTMDFHFSMNPSTWLTRYDEPTNTWEYLTDLNEQLYLGEGLDFYIEGSEDKVVDFAGPLSSSNLYLDGSTTPAFTRTVGQDGGQGSNFIGNPFSSAIDVDDVLGGLNNWGFIDIEKTIWVLDQLEGAASYRHRAVGSGAGNFNTDGIIPMGQGFFVHVTGQPSTASITIPAARRVHHNQTFYKEQKNTEYNGVDSYFIMDAINENVTDQIWVTFGENGSDDFDNGWDATKMFGSENAPQLYMKEAYIENNLSIDHLPNLSEEKRIVDLSFVAGTEGEQMFSANTTNLNEVDVELEDLLTGEFHRLNDNPIYSFSASKQDNPNRFRLHFYSVTGIDDPEDADNSNINIYAWDKTVYIRNHGEISNETCLVDIYDMMGKTVARERLSNSSIIRIPVNQNQTYLIVKYVMGNQIKVSKVYVK